MNEEYDKVESCSAARQKLVQGGQRITRGTGASQRLDGWSWGAQQDFKNRT